MRFSMPVAGSIQSTGLRTYWFTGSGSLDKDVLDCDAPVVVVVAAGTKPIGTVVAGADVLTDGTGDRVATEVASDVATPENPEAPSSITVAIWVYAGGGGRSGGTRAKAESSSYCCCCCCCCDVMDVRIGRAGAGAGSSAAATVESEKGSSSGSCKGGREVKEGVAEREGEAEGLRLNGLVETGEGRESGVRPVATAHQQGF